MKVNPLVVLLFNIILPVAIMIPGNEYRHYFFLGFATLTLLFTGKVKRVFKFAVFYGVLAGLHWFLYLGHGVSVSFLLIFFSIIMQFIPCMMMASILILDYSSNQITSSLEPFHLPKAFVVALAIVVRYIPTFKREFGNIKESMRLRNIPYSIRSPIKSFEYFLVPQLFRCAILADEITAAGLTKGITNPATRTSYYDAKMRVSDYMMCAVLVIGLGGTIIWR